nr:immunoglobulin heavy chain junction region [Macaca mulatta]
CARQAFEVILTITQMGNNRFDVW